MKIADKMKADKTDKESKKEIVKKWREVKKAKGSELTNSQLLQLILEVLDIKI
jgi:hypothetical protein